MEHLQAAVKATAVADPILKITAIARQLGYALYLANDHLVWVSELCSGCLFCMLKSRGSTAPLGQDQDLCQRSPCPDQLQCRSLLGSRNR